MRTCVDHSIQEILLKARREDRRALLDPEGFQALRALGFRVPASRFVRRGGTIDAADLRPLTGDQVVLKVVSPAIPHRSDVGGVAVVRKDLEAVTGALESMHRRFAGPEVAGFLIQQFVPYEPGFGRELLIGMRWTDDFGPVVTLGPGGIYADHLASRLERGTEAAILSPVLPPRGGVSAVLEGKAFTPALTGRLRGQPALLDMSSLEDALGRFLGLASEPVAEFVEAFEINPLVITRAGPVALDVLVRLAGPRPRPMPPRPLDRMPSLLRPRTLAIVGVSDRLNPGRIILRNILRRGFPADHVRVVKAGRDRIEGCRCVPGIADLPEPVDLMILAIAAPQVPGAVEEAVEHRKARSLIVIPGGLGERAGTEALAERMRVAIARSRESDWGGPILNGGNCLGIRSGPGRYDTLFIPESKLPAPAGPGAPVAIVSQSGALAVSVLSRLPALNPKYMISFGNQDDLTAGDYLESLERDRDIRLFACYLEGFRPLDGRRFLEAASRITAQGRSVILYRAGRTPHGAAASASHTASVAGDYAVTRELAREAGVMVAESLSDFGDLIRIAWLLDGTVAPGWHLGALSNAGFECVAIADALGRFRLPGFQVSTVRRLEACLDRCRLRDVVKVRNPVDVTPMMDDEAFEEAARAVLEDPGVDVGAIGCVPITGALRTVATEPLPQERGGGGWSEPGGRGGLGRKACVAERLARVRAESRKAWVAVVDAGPLYDPMVAVLEAGGVPVLRSADRALRLLEVWCATRIGR